MHKFLFLSYLSLLAAALAVVVAQAARENSIDLDGIRCKLPGWPGHPAPTCDASVPDQCCPGTKCAPDPYDPSHSTCQQTEVLTLADHALTASVLTSHVEFLVNSAVTQLKSASLGLYLSEPKQNLENTDIVERAMTLTSNHGNIHSGTDRKRGSDWHRHAHGGKSEPKTVEERPPLVKEDQPKENLRAKKDSGQQSPQQGGFDYSQYIPKQGGSSEDAKKGKGGGKSPSGHDGHKGDTGLDFGQFYRSEPHPAGDTKKHGKSTDAHDSHKGDQAGYDYSQYYHNDPDSKKKDKSKSSDSSKSSSGSGSRGDYDYSKYMPQSKNEQQISDDDDFLRRAALQLLQADLELRETMGQARTDVLERIKSILNQLEDIVDRQLDEDSQTGSSPQQHPKGNDDVPPGSVDNSGLAPELKPPPEHGEPTAAPTATWRHEKDDFWTRYIPNMPNQEAHSGDRRPGTLGGPCGRMDYKDFGPCLDKSLTCVGLTATKPGICQIDRDVLADFSRQSALNSLKLAEEAVQAIKAASIELMVGSVPLDATESASKKADAADDETIPLDPREYSPTMIFIVALAFSVIGYLCCVRSGKRRAYNSIDGWGFGSSRTLS